MLYKPLKVSYCCPNFNCRNCTYLKNLENINKNSFALNNMKTIVYTVFII